MAGQGEAITEKMREVILDAARRLTGWKRRAFQAKVAAEYCGGSARSAEREFGWGRRTVEVGLHEARTGIICIDNFEARGNKRAEVRDPRLEADIHALLEGHSQAEPRLRTRLGYTRITARAVRKALIEEKGWDAAQVASERTISDILNRLGYRLRSVQKTKPEKK